MTMKTKKQTVGERLKSLREAYKGRGVTAKAIADAAKISPMQLNNMENDRVKSFNYETVRLIAQYLGSTPEWIMDNNGDMLPNGLVEVNSSTDSNETSVKNPYRDFAIQQMEQRIHDKEQEASTWRQKYEQVWGRLEFLMDRMQVGKLKPVEETALAYTG
jgi:transcriptional regulator with XRE-family HTH domain